MRAGQDGAGTAMGSGGSGSGLTPREGPGHQGLHTCLPGNTGLPFALPAGVLWLWHPWRGGRDQPRAFGEGHRGAFLPLLALRAAGPGSPAQVSMSGWRAVSLWQTGRQQDVCGITTLLLGFLFFN